MQDWPPGDGTLRALDSPSPDSPDGWQCRWSCSAQCGTGVVRGAQQADQDDICFLAVEPARQQTVAFTAPYAVIEAVFAVYADSPLQAAADVDRDGVRIGVKQGSAYDLWLSRTLTRATVERGSEGTRCSSSSSSTLPPAFASPWSSSPHHGRTCGYWSQPYADPAGSGHHTLRAPETVAYLRCFVEELKADGFIAQSPRRSGRADAVVASPDTAHVKALAGARADRPRPKRDARRSQELGYGRLTSHIAYERRLNLPARLAGVAASGARLLSTATSRLVNPVSCFSSATTLSISAGSSPVDAVGSGPAADNFVAAVSAGGEPVLAVPPSDRDDWAFVGLSGGCWVAAVGLVDVLVAATSVPLPVADGTATAAGFDREDLDGRDGADFAPEVFAVFTACAEGDVGCAAS